MKALIAVAVVVASGPAIAAAASNDQKANQPRERRVCTRVERQGGSRLSYQRVCLTESQWRERLGADWRQILAGGNNPEDDFEGLDVRTRPIQDGGSAPQ